MMEILAIFLTGAFVVLEIIRFSLKVGWPYE